MFVSGEEGLRYVQQLTSQFHAVAKLVSLVIFISFLFCFNFMMYMYPSLVSSFQLQRSVKLSHIIIFSLDSDVQRSN